MFIWISFISIDDAGPYAYRKRFYTAELASDGKRSAERTAGFICRDLMDKIMGRARKYTKQNSLSETYVNPTTVLSCLDSTKPVDRNRYNNINFVIVNLFCVRVFFFIECEEEGRFTLESFT